MKKRKLGGSGLEVAPLALGGNVFGWTIDAAASFKILDAFVDRGGNLIDTADIYSAWVPGNRGGESETIIGQWLKKSGRRNQVLIATKVGMMQGPDGKKLSRVAIQHAVEKSLQRLQIDQIDLYQSHADDESVPLEETLETYAGLVKQGKVRAIGASNYSAPRLKEALRISRERDYPRYETLQPEYNLYAREGFEKDLEKTCADHGIGVINYYALASGFLTGKYRSEKDLQKSPRGQKVRDYLNDRGYRILKGLDQVAEQKRSTPARVALAWLMARPGIAAPIASATTPEQLDDLMKATELELSPEAIQLLDQASRG